MTTQEAATLLYRAYLEAKHRQDTLTALFAEHLAVAYLQGRRDQAHDDMGRIQAGLIEEIRKHQATSPPEAPGSP